MLLRDSSTRALRVVVLVLVRVSVRVAPERSFVTAPMPELVPSVAVDGSDVEAEGVVLEDEDVSVVLELVLGIVEVLLGDDVLVERELS